MTLSCTELLLLSVGLCHLSLTAAEEVLPGASATTGRNFIHNIEQRSLQNGWIIRLTINFSIPTTDIEQNSFWVLHHTHPMQPDFTVRLRITKHPAFIWLQSPTTPTDINVGVSFDKRMRDTDVDWETVRLDAGRQPSINRNPAVPPRPPQNVRVATKLISGQGNNLLVQAGWTRPATDADGFLYYHVVQPRLHSNGSVSYVASITRNTTYNFLYLGGFAAVSASTSVALATATGTSVAFSQIIRATLNSLGDSVPTYATPPEFITDIDQLRLHDGRVTQLQITYTEPPWIDYGGFFKTLHYTHPQTPGYIVKHNLFSNPVTVWIETPPTATDLRVGMSFEKRMWDRDIHWVTISVIGASLPAINQSTSNPNHDTTHYPSQPQFRGRPVADRTHNQFTLNWLRPVGSTSDQLYFVIGIPWIHPNGTSTTVKLLTAIQRQPRYQFTFLVELGPMSASGYITWTYVGSLGYGRTVTFGYGFQESADRIRPPTTLAMTTATATTTTATTTTATTTTTTDTSAPAHFPLTTDEAISVTNAALGHAVESRNDASHAVTIAVSISCVLVVCFAVLGVVHHRRKRVHDVTPRSNPVGQNWPTAQNPRGNIWPLSRL